MNPLDVKSSQHLHDLAIATSNPKFVEVQLLRSLATVRTKPTIKQFFNEVNGEMPQTLPQIANATLKDTSCNPLIIYFIKKVDKKYTLLKVLTKCIAQKQNPKIVFAILKQQEPGEDDSLKITKMTTAVKKRLRSSLSWKTVKIYYNFRIQTQHKICFH